MKLISAAFALLSASVATTLLSSVNGQVLNTPRLPDDPYTVYVWNSCVYDEGAEITFETGEEFTIILGDGSCTELGVFRAKNVDVSVVVGDDRTFDCDLYGDQSRFGCGLPDMPLNTCVIQLCYPNNDNR